MKMEEYVPKTMPSSNAKDKLRRVSPPKNINAKTTNNVAKLVNMVLLRVSFKLLLTISFIEEPFIFEIFSLILAKITIVSLTE